MSWTRFVAKCRHLFTSTDVSGQAKPVAGPVAVVCNCPNCGHVAMTVFLATAERIEAVKMADRSQKTALGDMSERNGASDDVKYQEHVLKARREKREEREKRPLFRTQDNDLRDQPEV